MAKVKEIALPIREQIIKLNKDGKSYKDISKIFHISKGAISKIIKKFVCTGTVADRPRCGRTRSTNPNIDRLIKRISQKDPRKSATDIHKELLLSNIHNVSIKTVQRRLRAMGLFGRKPVRKPLISKKNRKNRLAFAREHISWTNQKWSCVLFSDESKFNLFGNDGKGFVRRPVGKRFHQKYQQATVKHGGGNAMVWGCFSKSGVGPIVLIEEKMDRFLYGNILKEHMIPFAEENMPLRWWFQQDNDPKHCSRYIKDLFEEEKINVLKWPSQSPDLNPIEHLWEHIERQIRQNHTISNKSDLFKAIRTEWNRVSPEIIEKLIFSMNSRCAAVIQANGYATKY